MVVRHAEEQVGRDRMVLQLVYPIHLGICSFLPNTSQHSSLQRSLRGVKPPTVDREHRLAQVLLEPSIRDPKDADLRIVRRAKDAVRVERVQLEVDQARAADEGRDVSREPTFRNEWVDAEAAAGASEGKEEEELVRLERDLWSAPCLDPSQDGGKESGEGMHLEHLDVGAQGS